MKVLKPSRLLIKYPIDGSLERYGIIHIRRGLADCDLGELGWKPLKIAIDKEHYISGMGLYTDEELPEGVDIVYYALHDRVWVPPPPCPKSKVPYVVTLDFHDISEEKKAWFKESPFYFVPKSDYGDLMDRVADAFVRMGRT
jgi:hypothetical protein